MFGYKQILASVVVLALCQVELASSDFSFSELLPDFSDPFELLNVYLIEKEPSDDAVKNFDATNELVNEKRNATKKREKKLFGAAQKFLQLAKVDSGHKCDLESVRILADINEASKGKARTPVRPVTRVGKIINDYFVRHAEICKPEYTNKYEAALAEVEQILPEPIGDFLVRVADMRTKKSLNSYKIVKNLGPKSGWRTGYEVAFAYHAISDVAASDPDRRYLRPIISEIDGRRTVNKDKIGSLVRSHLVGPCSSYVAATKPIFDPAIFDLDLLYSMKRLTLAGLKEKRFYSGIALYKMCNYYIQDHKSLTNWLYQYVNRVEPEPSAPDTTRA